VPFVTHDLRSVVGELTQKINDLTARKAEVQGYLDAGTNPTLNRDALEKICQSLEAAKNGKILLENSCCNGQNCDIEFADV